MDKERLFEKVISTGNKVFGDDKPDPREIADRGTFAFITTIARMSTYALRLFYYQKLIERKGWQKDFSEYAMKNHSDFVKSLGVGYEAQNDRF